MDSLSPWLKQLCSLWRPQRLIDRETELELFLACHRKKRVDIGELSDLSISLCSGFLTFFLLRRHSSLFSLFSAVTSVGGEAKQLRLGPLFS